MEGEKGPNAGDALRNMKESPQYTRLFLSFLMQAVAVGYVVNAMYTGGTVDILESFYKAKAPWISGCGIHTEHKEFVILSDRIVGPRGVMLGGIRVRGGRIAETRLSQKGEDRYEVARQLMGERGTMKLPVYDYGDLVVGPGVIDVHVHMNEPGRVEWETMNNATKAASAGGVTTVVDMPLNSSPCTTTPKDVQEKARIARMPNNTFVHVGFWAGLVPGNAHSPGMLKSMIKNGALGFKAFMAPSGIDDFPHVSQSDIEAALPHIRDLNVPLLVHAEVVQKGLEGFVEVGTVLQIAVRIMKLLGVKFRCTS